MYLLTLEVSINALRYDTLSRVELHADFLDY